MKIKNRYRGVFNYQHEVHILYTFAITKQRARINFINQLGERVGREPWSLKGLYDGYLNNYSVILETEFEEVEETEKELKEGFNFNMERND